MNGVPLGLPFTVPASEATMETDGSLAAGCWRSAEGREGQGEESGGGGKMEEGDMSIIGHR